MNPGKCCTLRIENTGELDACSMPTGPQLQNKDTNQSVQKKSASSISLPCREKGFRYSSAESKITGLIFRIFPCDLVAR